MDPLLHIFKDKVNGIIEGFDRIIFKGTLKPFTYAAGIQSFLLNHKILNKYYKDWIQEKSRVIVEDASTLSLQQCGRDIRYLSSPNIRKEELAHQEQKESGRTSGLIAVYACVESCNTFKAVYNKQNGFPELKSKKSKCKHLYFYYDHEDLGFMSIRLQTWAPFSVQIALNGRQWLRRQLDKEGVPYLLSGNKFLHIDDYSLAQTLLNKQLDTRWADLFNRFVCEVFPSAPFFLEDGIHYTWTVQQSEWAKDYIFCDPESLNQYLGSLMRHAYLSGTSDRVLRYMGKPVMKNGQPYPNANPQVMSRVNTWHDGMRIRHWLDQNSVKCYNEQCVFRIEFTMNDPKKFLIYREVTGGKTGEKKQLAMRKGIADLVVRTQVCSDRIKNFTEHLATLKEEVTVGELVSGVSKAVKRKGKRYRGLEVTGKDVELLREIGDPKYNVEPISNKRLREALCKSEWSKGHSGRSLSARISRHLRLLREHGLIKKLPNQHKYVLTDKGRKLTTALIQFLGAKVDDLNKLAA